MITENQRRALFALREALYLCNDACLMLSLNDDGPGMTIESIVPPGVLAEVGVYLAQSDISDILEAHPDV